MGALVVFLALNWQWRCAYICKYNMIWYSIIDYTTTYIYIYDCFYITYTNVCTQALSVYIHIAYTRIYTQCTYGIITQLLKGDIWKVSRTNQGFLTSPSHHIHMMAGQYGAHQQFGWSIANIAIHSQSMPILVLSSGSYISNHLRWN